MPRWPPGCRCPDSSDQGSARRRDDREQCRKYQQWHELERIAGGRVGAILFLGAGEQQQPARGEGSSRSQRIGTAGQITRGWTTSTTAITLSTETIAASAAAPESGRGLPAGLRRPGKGDGHGRRRHERPGKPAEQQPPGGAEDLDRDMAEMAAIAAVEHGEEPDFPGVLNPPQGSIGWIGKQRQADRRHHRQHQRRAQLDPGDPPQETMQHLAAGEKPRQVLRQAGRCRAIVPGNGKRRQARRRSMRRWTPVTL